MTYADTFSLRAPSTVKMNDVANAIDGLITKTNGGTSTGTANVQALTLSPAATSYTDLIGVPISFLPVATNTSTMTINVNGLGTKAIVYKNNALYGGEVYIGVLATIVYNGTAFELLNHGGGWASWTPTYGAQGTGSPGFNSVTSSGLYQRHGKRCDFVLNGLGTTAGTTVTRIEFTLPLTPSANGLFSSFSAHINEAGTYNIARSLAVGASTWGIELYNGGNISIGANRRIYCQGFFEL